MIPFERHILVCTNRRDPQNPKGSCAQSGSEGICEFFKKELIKYGPKVGCGPTRRAVSTSAAKVPPSWSIPKPSGTESNCC